MLRRPRLLVFSLAALAVGCSKAPEEQKQDPPPTEEPKKLPDPICHTGGTLWKDQRAFVSGTAKTGLSALKIEGQRISVADFNHDGWPDLVVRKVGIGPPDDFDAGTRHTWLLKNDHGKFVDVTESTGFLTRRTPDGRKGRPGEVVAFADVDNDGDLDAYAGIDTEDPAKSLGETSEIVLNDGTGKFALGPADSELRRAGKVDVPTSASFVDYDLDGNLDLWIGQHNYSTPGQQDFLFIGGDRLYKGDGKGGFVDVTSKSGLATQEWSVLDDIDNARAHSRAWSAAAADLNGDGLPELLTASYGRAPNHLWGAFKNTDGSVAYRNYSVVSGYAYDDKKDWTDNQYARCYCQSHRSATGCANAPAPALDCSGNSWDPATDTRPFRLGGNSGTTIVADLNNDGRLDLVTTEIKHWWAGENSDGAEILVNNGGLKFDRPGRDATGLVIQHDTTDFDEGIMTGSALDFDNDGWQDLYLGASDYPGNHGLLFHHKAGVPLEYEPVPISLGIDHHRSHGIAVADFDRDGDLDVVVGHSSARCDYMGSDPCYASFGIRYFENVMGQEGNWVQLELEGIAGTNRSAIGARVEVTANGVTQVQEVSGGFGHFGIENDLALHFGLGAACEADVTIRWPNKDLTKQTVHVVSGYRFHVKQGEEPVVVSKE